MPPAPQARGPLRWEDWIGAAVMLLLAAITFANVIARYFTDQSFAWTEEISISLMVILTMVAASAAVARDRHIRIEAFFERGTPQRRRVLALVSAAATVVGFLVLTVLAARFAYDDYRFDVTSPGIGVPQWWYSVWLPVLSAAIAFRGAQVFWRKWQGRA
ncbi:TRAP transporter small permease [Ferrovibrio sp.]|jgi:TRAP-type C4-dicarboxylate transport system permease small subunit|uniref:TRAP transporter small permease n=1 Tax=Ferrovibrio sp. TaxID=1917215 RepID=UPI0035AD9353